MEIVMNNMIRCVTKASGEVVDGVYWRKNQDNE